MKKSTAVLRFITGGTMGGLTYYILIYILTDFFNLWYILSSIIAFICNVLINFIIHRFWTFEDKNKKATKQLIFYLILMVNYHVLNIVLLYLMVEYLNLYYLIAQLIITTVLFVPSFIFTKVIFTKK